MTMQQFCMSDLFACVWAHMFCRVCVCVWQVVADIKRKEEKEIRRQKEKTEVHLFDTESLRKCRGMSSMPLCVCALGANVCVSSNWWYSGSTGEWHSENGMEKSSWWENHTHQHTQTSKIIWPIKSSEKDQHTHTLDIEWHFQHAHSNTSCVLCCPNKQTVS